MRLSARHFVHAGIALVGGSALVVGVAVLPADAHSLAASTASPSPIATTGSSSSATGDAATNSPVGHGSSSETTNDTTTGTTNGTTSSGTNSSNATTQVSAPQSTSAADAAGTDPSIAVQNATGNHAMGASVRAAQAAMPLAPRTFNAAALGTPAGVQGMDVSAYQPNVDWQAAWNAGARFAYVKATEGTTYTSSQFTQQYNGAYNVGMVRGAYHYATPNTSSGAAQAQFFVANGGGWTGDGRTLPPLLDIEYGYTSTCWGLSQPAMVAWISDFVNTMYSLTGIYPAIYSTTGWWTACTGNSGAFVNDPLFIAYYPSGVPTSPGRLGSSWSSWALWQYADGGAFPGDQDVLNPAWGTLAQLASPARYTGASTLASGAVLPSGGTLASPRGGYQLTMQSNGNLVIRNVARQVVWQSGTSTPGSHLVMQTNGNLVIADADNLPVWNTATTVPGSSLILQDDSNLVVYSPSHSALFSALASVGIPVALPVRDYTGAGPTSLGVNGTMTAGTNLVSPTGNFEVSMQSDGNLVVYGNTHLPIWSSGTQSAGAYLTLQGDGNLVMHNASGAPIWNTQTSGLQGVSLNMQSDGNLVLYTSANAAVFNTFASAGYPIAVVNTPTPPVTPPTTTPNAVYSGASTLAIGATLNSGSWLASGSGRYELIMQGDGNLVVYNAQHLALWASRTYSPGAHVILQTDGNMVIYAASGAAIWDTQTYNGSQLVMQNDSNVVLYTSSHAAAFNTFQNAGIAL